MPTISRIAPCLWFDSEAEEAARFYTGIFPNSRINSVSHFPAVGQEVHGQEAGKALTVVFELDGQSFTALNGGPLFRFNEALSLQVFCDNQEEVDYYWARLCDGGQESECSWLKDRYGLSWQVVPRLVAQYLLDPDPRKVARVFAAIMKMRKIDIEELRRAYAG